MVTFEPPKKVCPKKREKMGSFFSRWSRSGDDRNSGNQKNRPSRVNEQDRAVLVWRDRHPESYTNPVSHPGTQSPERQTEEIPKEGKKKVAAMTPTVSTMSILFQIGIQLDKERDVAKQLLRDGKRE